MLSQFNSCASEYNKFRPEYPLALFQLLIESFDLSNKTPVADIGCGTARASIAFAQAGIPILGLDPSLEMLKLGKTSAKELNLPVVFLQSKAEEIPLLNNSISFINCAQAFHWFDSQKALREFSRILKPNGGFAIYWNNRDQSAAPYLAEVEALISKYNPRHKLGYRAHNWELIIKESNLFTEIQYHTFLHKSDISIEDFVGLTRSFSYVRNVLNDENKILFETELIELLQTVSNNDQVPLPYEVTLWCAKKQ